MGSFDKLETIVVLGVLAGGAYLVWKYGGAIVGAIEAPFKALEAGAAAIGSAASGAASYVGTVATNTAQDVTNLPNAAANNLSNQVTAAANAPNLLAAASPYILPQNPVNAAEQAAANAVTGGLAGPLFAGLAAGFNAAVASTGSGSNNANTIGSGNNSNTSLTKSPVIPAANYSTNPATNNAGLQAFDQLLGLAAPVTSTPSGSGNSGSGASGSGNANVSPAPTTSSQTFDISTAAGLAAFNKAYGR